MSNAETLKTFYELAQAAGNLEQLAVSSMSSVIPALGPHQADPEMCKQQLAVVAAHLVRKLRDCVDAGVLSIEDMEWLLK
jgi:hypothetical protein